MHPFPAVGLVFAIFFFFFLGGFHPGSLPFPPLSVVFWSPLAPFWLQVGCNFFVMFFGSVFLRFLSCFWLVLGVNFACFSHTCSNCFFAYFFLGCFSNLCTLSKHGIFKTHGFSRVKTLFWRNRLCIRNLRISIFWGWIVPCFLLNFTFFWRVFLHSFSLRFLDTFLFKNTSKMSPKLSSAPPLFRPFSRLCFFVVFLLISGSLLAALWDPLCSFWHPSGSYWDPLGALLAHIGTVLVPFRARFGLFCTLGGLLLARFGRNSIFKAEICKKTLLHWPWY